MNGSTEVETRQPETPLKDEIGSNADVKKQVEIHVPSSDNSGTLDAPTSQARALLPRNTLVRIVGNARTNPKLIGLEGQVRRAMGLGGWHWIATPDGQEIKIQRNALLVLKLPDYEEETSDSGDPVPPPVPSTSRPQRCVPSRTFISRQSLRNASLYAASLNWDDFSSMHSRSDGSMAGRVDLRNLETPALKKYCAAHGVAVSSDASRNVLLAAACGHFSRFQVEEMDVIRRLIAVSGNGRSATPSSYC